MTLKNANQEIAGLVERARLLLNKAKDIANDHNIPFAFSESFVAGSSDDSDDDYLESTSEEESSSWNDSGCSSYDDTLWNSSSC